MFTLRIDDLEKMKMEFPDSFQDLFKGANERLQKELILKLEVIKRCEASSESKTDMRSRFASLLLAGLKTKVYSYSSGSVSMSDTQELTRRNKQNKNGSGIKNFGSKK